MYICLCNAVTEQDIRRCVREGACSLTDLASCAGVGAGCGRCRNVAAALLKEAALRDPAASHAARRD